MIVTEQMQENEKADIRQILDTLFSDGCIMETIYNPKTDVEKDNPLYSKCQVYEEDLRTVLDLMGYELCHAQAGDYFYYIRSDRKGTVLSKLTTYVMVLLRQIYDTEMNKLSTKRISTTKKEILELGSTTGLITEPYKEREWEETFSLLKSKKIISYAGDVKSINPHTRLFIHGPITMHVSGIRMMEFCNQNQDIIQELSEQDTEQKPEVMAEQEESYNA